jgi:hypothetical protein
MNRNILTQEAKAWIKRSKSDDEIVRVIPAIDNDGPVLSYELFTAYEEHPDNLGRILFDAQGYWIYDGNVLTVTEQEQLAKFIINYKGAV